MKGLVTFVNLNTNIVDLSISYVLCPQLLITLWSATVYALITPCHIMTQLLGDRGLWKLLIVRKLLTDLFPTTYLFTSSDQHHLPLPSR